jgi:penicillin-binding protein 1C
MVGVGVLAMMLIVGAGLLAAAVWGGLTAEADEALARLENLDQSGTFQTTHIYDREGVQLHQLFTEGRRTEVTLDQISPHLINATIALEDDTFYENPGIDLQSIIRAGIQYLREGRIVSGASTITQQVVKNIAFPYEEWLEQTIQRKLKEMAYAQILTRRLSKDEILALYLNAINYGNHAYGIEAAARTIFNKGASDLTLPEAAMLAGLPQAPAELDPLTADPEISQRVKARQKLVLDLMAEKGFITEAEAADAYAQNLILARPDVALEAPHFTIYASRELEALFQELGRPVDEIASGGLKVYTSLDMDIARMVEAAAQDQIIEHGQQHNMSNAAVIVLSPRTGEILAMLGSVDYWNDGINGRVNVTTSPQQPGSAMKPLTYAAAMELGWTPATILWDTETHIGDGDGVYVPVNYDRSFHGPVRVRTALARSYNVPAVQMLRKVGVSNLLAMARRLGIESLGDDAAQYGLSLTLGGGELTPLELATAYAVLANGGSLVEPRAIRCVLDSDDAIIYEYNGGCPPEAVVTPESRIVSPGGVPVLDPRIAFLITDILSDNDARGPAMGYDSPLNTAPIQSAAKTGTTNDWRDNWTVGYTQNVVVAVWAGNTNNEAMINTTGLTGAAPIWHEVMVGVHQDSSMSVTLAGDGGMLLPDRAAPPPGLERRRVCALGSLSDPALECPQSFQEWFLASPATVPGSANPLSAPNVTPTPQPTPVGAPPQGVQVAELEPGLVQALVQPLAPDVAQAQAALYEPVPGLPLPPVPKYCLLPGEYAGQNPAAKVQLFLEPPADPGDAVYARLWANDHNLPVLPAQPCNPAMLRADGAAAGLDATWIITSPKPGDEVSGVFPIMGTARFLKDQVQFYKLEIAADSNPDHWITFSEMETEPVIDGQLGELHADADVLPAGDYFIRLAVVRWDGNYPTPYVVPITIVK